MSESTWYNAGIGLGANLGDAQATLQHTLAELAQHADIRALHTSAWYRSAPVEASGPDFLNAAACFQTRLAPLALLDLLQALEQQHGRQRPYRNAPRTLDLDLLFYGQLTLDTPRLTLPHPRLRERAFVLLPLQDLCAASAPGVIPFTADELQHWLTACGQQRIERLPDPPPAAERAASGHNS